MSVIVDIYMDAVYGNLRPLRAKWEPTQPVKIGDYGTINGEAFERLGTISDRGIKLGEVIEDDVGDQKIFSSGSYTEANFNAEGSAPADGAASVSANLAISFAAANGAFFNVAGCSYSILKDKTALAKQIMKLYKDDNWERDWAVITDLIRAKSTTIVISGGTNASIVLEADAKVTQIDLADASVGLKVKNSKNIGYQVIAKKNLTPLLGLSKIQSSFWNWGGDFKPLTSKMMANWHHISSMQDSIVVETESEEALYFGQLM